MIDLAELFERINSAHFDGFLEAPRLRWNGRLCSSAGRFIPGRKRFLTEFPPTIEVASYLVEENQAEALVADTLAHEMIHLRQHLTGDRELHGPRFRRMATRVCIAHGFDPKIF